MICSIILLMFIMMDITGKLVVFCFNLHLTEHIIIMLNNSNKFN